jgi:hypothetical protein
MGIFEAMIGVPALESLLETPRIEGVTSLSRQDWSNDDLHGGFLSTVS